MNKKILYIIGISFVTTIGFVGCTSKICGLDEDIYNKLSNSEQQQTCKLYQAEQLERQRQLQRKEEADRLYSQEMLSKAYAIGDIVRVTIIDGEMRYGKSSYRTGSQGFILANGEAKKVSIYANGANLSEEIWFGYKNGTLYVDFKPSVNNNNFYIKEEDNSMYFSAKLHGVSKYSWQRNVLEMPNGFYVKKLLIDVRG